MLRSTAFEALILIDFRGLRGVQWRFINRGRLALRLLLLEKELHVVRPVRLNLRKVDSRAL